MPQSEVCCRQLNVFYIDMQNPASEPEPGQKTTASDTLLILHGFPTSSADFQGQVRDALQQRFRRVITFDYPGAQMLCTWNLCAEEHKCTAVYQQYYRLCSPCKTCLNGI